jgi:hypothetical protein
MSKLTGIFFENYIAKNPPILAKSVLIAAALFS